MHGSCVLKHARVRSRRHVPELEGTFAAYCGERLAVGCKGDAMDRRAVRLAGTLLSGGDVPKSDNPVHARRCHGLAVRGEGNPRDSSPMPLQRGLTLFGGYVPQLIPHCDRSSVGGKRHATGAFLVKYYPWRLGGKVPDLQAVVAPTGCRG